MNLHVTGGTGFLGSFVIRVLIDRGHVVTALVRSAASARAAEDLGAKPLHGDLDDPKSIEEAFLLAAPDALVNMASLGFGHAPAIIAAAQSAGIRRTVFVSTTSIFTDLDPPSKQTRRAAEDEIQASDLDWTIVRPSMIYGARGDRNMERLLRFAKRYPLIPLPGGGKGLQQPVHVKDLAHAIAIAVESPKSARRSYDLAGPSALPLRKVCEHAARSVGRTPRFLALPLPALVAVVRLVEHAGLRPRVSSEQLRRLAEDKVFDVSAARADLAFEPREFKDGMRDEAAQLE